MTEDHFRGSVSKDKFKNISTFSKLNFMNKNLA